VNPLEELELSGGTNIIYGIVKRLVILRKSMGYIEYQMHETSYPFSLRNIKTSNIHGISQKELYYAVINGLFTHRTNFIPNILKSKLPILTPLIFSLPTSVGISNAYRTAFIPNYKLIC